MKQLELNTKFFKFKGTCRFASYVFLCLFLVFGAPACAEDAPQSANDSEVSLDSDAANSDTNKNKAARTAQVKAGLTHAQTVEQAFDRFCKDVLALSEEVKRLPVSYKKRASDYAELEARLANYPKKGALIREEASTTIRVLEQELNPTGMIGKVNSTTQIVDVQTALGPGGWEQKLKELDTSVKDYDRVYKELEKAVEKLKKANGAPVVLFE